MENSPLQKHPEFITKGAEVEVTSEEEGYSGAWYEATVVNPPSLSLSKRKKKSLKEKVHVEYKTLFADNDFSNPLREYVDVHLVRPPYPPLSDKNPEFELYDVVDASYKDGWWTGVITRFVGFSGFVVTFTDPPDELQFRAQDLRFHVDWVNHAWVRPPKQKIPGLIFGEGKEVEVLIQHNQDIWYPATVVENHTDSLFLVEYMALKEGTNETEPQKVTVDSSHIRPSPPLLKDRLFDLFEKVDVLKEFGWCTGLITKALPDNRYTVFFPNLKRGGEFDSSEIRPQIDWKDSKWWFASSQEEVTLFQENPGVHVVSELSDIYSGRTCVSSQKNTAMSDKQTGGVDITSGSPPSNITGENILIDVTGWDQPSDYPSSGMRTPKKQKKMDGKEFHMLNSRRKPRQAGEECNNDFTKLVEHVERNSGRKKDDAAFMSLERCNLNGSKARKTCLNNGEECLQLEGDQKQLTDLPIPDKGDQPETEKSDYKRKRGRPKNVFTGSLKAERTEQVRNTATNYDIIIKDSMSKVYLQVAPESMLMSTEGLLPAENSLMPIDDCITLVCAQLDHENDSGSTIGKSSSRIPTDSNDQAEQRTSENKISEIPDGPVAKPAKPFCMTKEVIDSSDVQNHVLVDPDTLMEQSAELRQIRNELKGQTLFTKDNKTRAVVNEEVDAQSQVLVDGKTSITTTDEFELPFVKNSSLWKEIESMEVLRKMPQKPHFRPLQQYNEHMREGFAIGYMVNFCSAVEKITWLRFDDMDQKIDNILNSLNDLESQGFVVQVLRDKMSEMGLIKEKHKKLHEEVEVIHKQIASCKLEKADQDKEISEVTKQVKKLEETIAKAQSIKEMKDGEIAVLESRRLEVEESLLSSRSRYEALASGVCE